MNGAGNKDTLKVFDLDFAGSYEVMHHAISLADLSSKNEKDKPFILIHPTGSINARQDVSEELLSKQEQSEVSSFKIGEESERIKELRVKCAEISRNLIIEEFDLMFKLLEKTNHSVLYERWMPKNDEIYLSLRENPKGHHICLYFFYNHNQEKSILIANPNGCEIAEEPEANVISSYLKKNPAVKIYQSQDYTQFGQVGCGPGTLVLLRMLYNMQEKDFYNVLRKGNEKTSETENQFNFTSVEFGQHVLQKEIGKIPQKNTQEEKDVDQKLRRADYEVAKICGEEEINNSVTKDGLQLFKEQVDSNQEFINNLTKHQTKVLRGSFSNSRFSLNQEQIPQAQQKRGEILGIERKISQNGNNTQLSNSSSSPTSSIQKDVEVGGLSPEQVEQQQQKRLDGCNKKVKFHKDHKPAEKSEFSKILATTAAFIGVALLCSAILIDIKKEFKIGGIVLSSVMLISAVTCFFLPGKTPESKITIATENTPVFKTIAINQQPNT